MNISEEKLNIQKQEARIVRLQELLEFEIAMNISNLTEEEIYYQADLIQRLKIQLSKLKGEIE